MKPRRFPSANKVWRLQGGNEDNDLWAEVGSVEDEVLGVVTASRSVWEPSVVERSMIADGANISLTIIGGQPPVELTVTDERLGR